MDFTFDMLGSYNPFDAFLNIPRSQSRSSDGPNSPNQGGGQFAIDPQLLDSPHTSAGSQLNVSPYLPPIDSMLPHSSFDDLPPIGLTYGSYPGESSFKLEYQRQRMSPYAQEAAGPSRQIQHSPSPIPPPHTLSQLHLNDGPPPEVPDAGPFLRRKHHIPPGVEINLDALPDPEDGEKPSHTLPTLISLAIYGSPRKMLTLSEIYTAIERRFEWYRLHPRDGWKGSIRHNLSLNLLFRNKDRPITEPGKGNYWYIDISSGQGNKRDRKRRAGRKDDNDNDEEDEIQSVNEDEPSSSRKRTKAPSSRAGARRGNSAPASLAVRPTRHSTRLAQRQLEMEGSQMHPFSAPSPYHGSPGPSMGEPSFHDSYLAAVGLSNPRSDRERPFGYRPYSAR